DNAVSFYTHTERTSSLIERRSMDLLSKKASTYEVLREHGVDRRSFIKFCTMMAAALGLESSMVPTIVAALENKPRLPVLWLHGLECTCCSESFIRSSHPI